MKQVQVLGVQFCAAEFDEVIARALQGGLVVAPSGPGLADDLVRSHVYREALRSADVVLTDSGYMVLLWRLLSRERLPRHSGLKFIRAILDRPESKQAGAILWVMPSEADAARNRSWLVQNGVPVEEGDVYVAPLYPKGEIVDQQLEARIEARRPTMVILGIGGGVQERLGLSLKARLSYRPGIFCIGAAIAFLTGSQTAIPPWADSLRLGWLLRILSSPRAYLPRYITALKLAPLLWRYRDRMPPARWATEKVPQTATLSAR